MKVVGDTSTIVHEDRKRSQSSGEGQVLSEQERMDYEFWRAEGEEFWSCKGEQREENIKRAEQKINTGGNTDTKPKGAPPA